MILSLGGPDKWDLSSINSTAEGGAQDYGISLWSPNQLEGRRSMMKGLYNMTDPGLIEMVIYESDRIRK